jgi:hypothetical protein
MMAEPMNTGDLPSASVKGASRVRSTPGNGGPGRLRGMRYPEGGTCGTGTIVEGV